MEKYKNSQSPEFSKVSFEVWDCIERQTESFNPAIIHSELKKKGLQIPKDIVEAQFEDLKIANWIKPHTDIPTRYKFWVRAK